MDLFEDLPEPGKAGSKLFGDLPGPGKAGSKLFGDLPGPGKAGRKLFGDLPGPGRAGSKLFGDLPGPSKAGSKDSNSNQSLSLYDDTPINNTQASQNTAIEEPKRKNVSDALTPEKKLKSSVQFELDSYLTERQGEREDMQDAHIILKDYTSLFTSLHPTIYRLSLYGIFDGHGGVRASRFASENLHKNLRDKFPKGDVTAVEKDIKKAFVEAFKKTDDDFLKEAGRAKPSWKDGTTAIVLLIINDTMYIANIGDSQAVLCRYKEDTKTCAAVPLSVPHNPSMYDERMRIQKQGGYVKDGRVMGVLEVSRSIGDGQYKTLGVTCAPDVKKCQITDNDRYVIMACDGLWKCFQPEDSIKFVNSILEGSKEAVTRTSSQSERFDTACNRLANEAVLRFSGDNVTVLLLALHKNRPAT
ncbi:integrin-linked kinase-associated serine/threonine phosphatase 2C-like [Dreissena polymorpha]|uniref:integrin-linked kinase-associated serine/threonine phosphatase 2C-like n=1 Tax=Dreissena polymorpha TaxID=45954 RepID=UPI0022652158|nr:integrin-linked kinase-associated serine/threonine phosphatase 2C-like [Dreissena polymorpha]